MDRTDKEPRGLAPPCYAVLFLGGGLFAGFITVTLTYVLGRHGVSVAAIAGVTALALVPSTFIFIAGPIVDVSLSPRRWYVIASGLLAACFSAFAVTPMTANALPVLGGLCFASSASIAVQYAAGMAAMAATTPAERRGPIAGWVQTANLGGGGLGGGLGLWIVGHAGGPTAAGVTFAILVVLSAAPILLMHVPPRTIGVRLGARARSVAVDVWRVARTRKGVLAIVAVTLPAALGAGMTLLPAVAGDWRASSDLVALVGGALGGAASIPGCLIGGYLCTSFRPRTVYMCAALAYALGEAAMALAPHTPAGYVTFVILNALILGVAWGALTAIIFDCLGLTGAGTVGTILTSASNVPVLVMTLLVGQAQTRVGSGGMLLTEAIVAVVAVAAYALLAWFWKPGGEQAPSAAAV